MKILIIGDATSPFTIHFTKWVKKTRANYTIDVFNTSNNIPDEKIYNSYHQIFPNKHFKKINLLTSFKSLYYVRKSLLSIKKSEYDVIILHYVYPWYAPLSSLIKSRAKKLIATFWGSDLNRISPSKMKRLPKLFRKTDAIILGSPMLFDKIIIEHPSFKAKYNMCYFGCEPIEEVKNLKEQLNAKVNSKKNLQINPKLLTIALGYNGGKSQQHINILKNLKASKELILYKNKIHFIIPITYGLNDIYLSEINNELNDFDYSYSIIKEYMNEKESAILRMATDIFVNLQLTDSFNGTLRESFYAGNVIINGDWLPYRMLKNMGLYFHEINTINNFDKKLSHCLKNYELEKEKSRPNESLIYEISSWSKTIENWLKVIEQ